MCQSAENEVGPHYKTAQCSAVKPKGGLRIEGKESILGLEHTTPCIIYSFLLMFSVFE